MGEKEGGFISYILELVFLRTQPSTDIPQALIPLSLTLTFVASGIHEIIRHTITSNTSSREEERKIALFYFGRINRDILDLRVLLALEKVIHILCIFSSLTDAHELKILKYL